MTTQQRELVAADLMTIEPIVIAMDEPIEEAERLLRERQISGLPVIDGDGQLVGVISQTDFLHLANPEVRSLIRNTGSGIRVGEVMSRPPLTVLLSTTLLQAARTMVLERVHRLVVVDGAKRPVGVLSATDFVTLFAEG